MIVDMFVNGSAWVRVYEILLGFLGQYGLGLQSVQAYAL